MSALIPLPSTPRVTPAPAPSPAPPPSPGTWRHPQFAEIVSRRNASTFSDQDFKRAAFNLIALLISFTFSSELNATLQTLIRTLPNLHNRTHSTATYTFYTILALRLYLLLNLSLALFPFLPSRANDTISDIPLTTSQRALMGLPPSPAPSPSRPTPNAAAIPASTPRSSSNSPTASSPAYITPPRYKRTSYSPSPSSTSASSSSNNALGPATPTSGRSMSANYSPSSPLSGRGFAPSPNSHFRSLSSSRPANYSSNSPFSPTPRSSSGSPLLQKALTSNTNSSRDSDPAFRSSFSPSTPGSGLRRSQSVREGAGVRSPGSGNGSGSGSRSPAVNYKWLYEKEGRMQVRGGGAGLLSRSESIQF